MWVVLSGENSSSLSALGQCGASGKTTSQWCMTRTTIQFHWQSHNSTLWHTICSAVLTHLRVGVSWRSTNIYAQ